jgi:plasmid stabilization system protein ParE
MGAKDKYQLEYAPAAYADLYGILDYISNELQEPDTAYEQIERIEASTQALGEFPYKAPLARDIVLLRIEAFVC